MIMWRVKILDPTAGRRTGRRRRMSMEQAKEIAGDSALAQRRATDSYDDYTFAPTTAEGAGSNSYYTLPAGETYAPTPYGYSYDPYASSGSSGQSSAEEYEPPSDKVALDAPGVDCIVFNFTGVSGFTYKGRKPIRKMITMLFTIDSTIETAEKRIFDFGVNGLDMFYFSDPDLLPGAAYHLANDSKPNDFRSLGIEAVPFVIKPSVFSTAYEDTNIVGITSVTQLTLSRVETTTADDPRPVVSHAIKSVAADLNTDQVNERFGKLPPPAPGFRQDFAQLIMTFQGPEITEYLFLPPQVGALLGQLGGLKGLVVVRCSFGRVKLTQSSAARRAPAQKK